VSALRHADAAGSLRGALSEVIAAYAAASGDTVQPKFGASGLLKDEIASGAKAEVFTSANMGNPQALARENRAGPVVLFVFARNRLCALVRPGLAVEPATLLDRMLDPQLKLGTSTPRADPSGDYAWEVFRKAETVRPGAYAQLEAKALQLIGGAVEPTATGGSYDLQRADRAGCRRHLSGLLHRRARRSDARRVLRPFRASAAPRAA